jgi:hypothetical protein
MNRRGFFATILGAIAAKLTPRPTSTLVPVYPTTNEVSFLLINATTSEWGYTDDWIVTRAIRPNPANHKYEPNDPRRLPL